MHGPSTPLSEEVEGVRGSNEEHGDHTDDAHSEGGDIALTISLTLDRRKVE